MKKVFALILTTAILLSLAACHQAAPQTETVCEPDGAMDTQISITDLAGQTHTFDKPVDKVIIQWTAGGGPFFTLAGLFGAEVTDHLVNLDDGLQAGRADMWEQFVKELPALAELPDIGSMHKGSFDVEAAAASQADAMILPLSLKTTVEDGDIDDKMMAAGIPIVYMDYHAETLENHTKSITIMGQMFGKEERAQEMVDFYTTHVKNVYDRVNEILKTNQRPLVHMEVAWDSPASSPSGFSNDYAWGKMVYDAGGTCTGEGIIQGEAELQPEYLLSVKPDKLILGGSYWPKNPESVRIGYQSTAEETRKLVDGYINGRTGWNEMPAVKNGEIYVVPHALARDVFDCACLEALAKDIWPEEFADLDPTATLQDFFARFMPFTFGGTWFMKY